MRYTILAVSVLTMLLTSSCTSTMKVASGASDNRPLLFADEYDITRLPELEVEGSAFFGIPSFRKNNQHNRSTGIVLYLNGIETGRVSRGAPILTLLATSFVTGSLIQRIGGRSNEVNNNFGTNLSNSWNVPYSGAYVLGFPFAGMINNLIWSNAAYSGASRSLNFRLVDEYPEMDIFFYPRYTTVKNKDGGNLKYLFVQDASVKAKVLGGRLRPTVAP